MLIRIEEQARAKAAVPPQPAPPGRRARQLVKEGAYKKGVTALTTSVASLTAVEQEQWARELLPTSAGPGALAHPAEVSLAAQEHPSEAASAEATAAGRANAAAGDAEDAAEEWGHGASGSTLCKAALEGVRFLLSVRPDRQAHGLST